MSIPLPDILALVFVFVISVTVSLGWVHLSSQSIVPRSYQTGKMIVTRLLVTVGLGYVILCVLPGMPVVFFVAGTAVVLLVSPFATHHGVAGDGEFEFAVANTLILPVYALKQFILGFPDRDILIPPPPDTTRPSYDLSRLAASIGTVTGTLKPCGTVQIDGSVYSAVAADGQFLDAGAQIRVVGIRNTMLVVVAAETGNT